MSIHLSEYLTSNHSVRENAAMRGASDAAGAGSRPGQDAVTLKQGEHIRGTVVETDGNRALIDSKEHGMFYADLESGVRVEKGDVLDFEVRGMLGKQIALTPLYSNLSANSSVMKALQAAGLPLTDVNVRMVGEMMNQGMGIDRNSLHSMAGMVSRFAGYDPSLLVQMKQMGIPLTEENVMQTELYRNNEAQIQNSFAEVSDQMQSLMKDMAANGEYEALGRLFTETARLFLQDTGGQEIPVSSAQNAAGEESAQTAGTHALEDGGAGENGAAGEVSANGEKAQADVDFRITAGDPALGEDAQGQNAARGDGIAQDGSGAQSVTAQGKDGMQEQPLPQVGEGEYAQGPAQSGGHVQGETLAQNGGYVQGEALAQNGEPIRAQIPSQGGEHAQGQIAAAGGENRQSGNVMREGGALPGDAENISTADAKSAEMRQPQNTQDLPNITAFLARTAGNTAQAEGAADYRRLGMEAARLIKQPGFEKEFERMLTKKWLLTPQQTADKEQVRRLYDHVLRQTRQLQELLSGAGKQSSLAAKSLQNMEKNVDFMNELNQQFAYVQLPLRMSRQNAHGDLYVYARKHRLTGRDDTVTAFLHLGMDHLGEMDIYVALSQNKVNTKFYLENESVIDFLEGHMDELNERLKQKGYSAQAQVLSKEQEDKKSVFEVMLGDSAGAGTAPPIMLSHRSFDARA